ncbi:MAG: nicotinate-nucleotide pyrophosphorylase (carboxylating) [Candidatus Poseidoniaceae archaeon]
MSALLADDGINMPFMGGSQNISATICARADGMIVGTAAVDHMLQIWAPSLKISWMASDGKKVSQEDEIATVSGDRETLLAMERSILNLLGQLSGIATETKRWSARAPGQIACTRKTVWGLLDKWAVHLGGGLTHRLHRDDAKLLKENDLISMYQDLDTHASRIVAYLQEVSVDDCGAFLEIEVREDKEAIMAAAAWAQREGEALPKLVIMLDNFGPERSRDIAAQLVEMNLRDHVCLEASGGIVYDQLDEWHESGIDVLSTSAVNRGVSPLDISMIVDGA